MLPGNIISEAQMGVSTSRAAGCGSSQLQCPFLVPSSCRSIPGFPELLKHLPISPRCRDAQVTLAAPEPHPRSQGSLASPLESPHGSVRDPSVPSSWEVTFQIIGLFSPCSWWVGRDCVTSSPTQLKRGRRGL